MRAWRGESSSQKVHHSYSSGMKILSNFHNPGAESVPRKVTRQQCCLQTAAEPWLRCAPLLAPCLNAAQWRADAEQMPPSSHRPASLAQQPPPCWRASSHTEVQSELIQQQLSLQHTDTPPLSPSQLTGDGILKSQVG